MSQERTGYFVLSGPYGHWKYGLQHHVWGVNKGAKKQVAWWRAMSEGDRVILYCSGITAVLGVGRVVRTRQKRGLWWPEEEDRGENVYRYVIDLGDLTLAVDPAGSADSWASAGATDFRALGLTAGHVRMGLCKLVASAQLIFEKTESAVHIAAKAAAPKEKSPPEVRVSEMTPQHDTIRDTLVEVGRLLAYSAEPEYRIDSKRLDAVWKRVPQGNPTHAFEVQIGGNFFEAMTKLKHAWDIWNSTPVLVTTEQYQTEAEGWLTGSFHEVRHVLRVVRWQDVMALANLMRDVRALRDVLGFW